MLIDNLKEDLKDIEDWQTAEGIDYVWYQYDYVVAEFDGIYSKLHSMYLVKKKTFYVYIVTSFKKSSIKIIQFPYKM